MHFIIPVTVGVIACAIVAFSSVSISAISARIQGDAGEDDTAYEQYADYKEMDLEIEGFLGKFETYSGFGDDRRAEIIAALRDVVLKVQRNDFSTRAKARRTTAEILGDLNRTSPRAGSALDPMSIICPFDIISCLFSLLDSKVCSAMDSMCKNQMCPSCPQNFSAVCALNTTVGSSPGNCTNGQACLGVLCVDGTPGFCDDELDPICPPIGPPQCQISGNIPRCQNDSRSAFCTNCKGTAILPFCSSKQQPVCYNAAGVKTDGTVFCSGKSCSELFPHCTDNNKPYCNRKKGVKVVCQVSSYGPSCAGAQINAVCASGDTPRCEGDNCGNSSTVANCIDGVPPACKNIVTGMSTAEVPTCQSCEPYPLVPLCYNGQKAGCFNMTTQETGPIPNSTVYCTGTQTPTCDWPGTVYCYGTNFTLNSTPPACPPLPKYPGTPQSTTSGSPTCQLGQTATCPAATRNAPGLLQ